MKEKIAFLITTYNRKRSLLRLVESIRGQGDIFIVNDGGEYVNIKGATVLTNEHRGKAGYYLTVTDLWHLVKLRGDYNYYFMIPDDMLPVENFVERAINQWKDIKDCDKICLNLYTDKLRYMKSCWTHVPSIDRGNHLQTGWVDMAFLAEQHFFEFLNYTVAKPDRDFTDEKLGSGVGSVISKYLVGQKKTMFQVKNTLLIPQPEAYASKMNPCRVHDINETI